MSPAGNRDRENTDTVNYIEHIHYQRKIHSSDFARWLGYTIEKILQDCHVVSPVDDCDHENAHAVISKYRIDSLLTQNPENVSRGIIILLMMHCTLKNGFSFSAKQANFLTNQVVERSESVARVAQIRLTPAFGDRGGLPLNGEI